MTTTGIGPLVAFAGGLLSFLSPCVLPLVPSYISFLAGMTGDDLRPDRHRALAHAAAFIAGFSLVFIALGAAATALGAGLLAHKLLFARLGGVLILVFGLYTLGLLRLSALDRERRVQLDDKPVGFLGSVLVGMAFAAGWTPCIGPILGGILVLAGTSASVAHGVALLAAYSLGLAVPFLVAAFALDAFMIWFRRFRRWMPWVQRVSGIVLVVVGLLMVSGEFTRMAYWLQSLTPAVLQHAL
jgi:cytochrome c-type biogenesis protein